MSVTDLHPEDLLDREARGELTAKERAHLDAHLAHCAACRLEREVRADFAAELDEEDLAGGALLVSKILAAPAPEPPLEVGGELAAPEPAPLPRASARPSRARRRAGALVVIAAALTLGGVAVAARGTSALAVFFPETGASHAASRHAEPPDGPAGGVARAAGSIGTPAVVEPTPAPADSTEETPRVMTSATATATAAPSVVAPPPRVASATATVEAPAAPPASIATPPAAPADASGLFAEAGAARRAGEHGRAAALYRDLVSRFPASSEAASARIALGRMLLDDGDASGALAEFDAYLLVGGALAEEAMAGRARALGRLGRAAEERAAWTTLLSARPRSIHAERARARLQELDRR